MEDYLQLLPLELTVILYRYVYGPIIINAISGTKDTVTLQLFFDVSWSTRATAVMTIGYNELAEFLANPNGKLDGRDSFCFFRNGNDMLILQYGSIAIGLDATTSKLVTDKLSRIVGDWGKWDSRY